MLLMVACLQNNRSTYVDELQCNNMSDPEGIDTPLLSWKIKSSRSGVIQTAWEVEIASTRKLLKEGAADIWKSGTQVSDIQFGIQPATGFTEGGTYFWRVRIWDNDDQNTPWSEPARFSMGLLHESHGKPNGSPFPMPERVHSLLQENLSIRKGRRDRESLDPFLRAGCRRTLPERTAGRSDPVSSIPRKPITTSTHFTAPSTLPISSDRVNSVGADAG